VAEQIIDLSAIRTAAGLIRDSSAAMLELRERRRRLEKEVDALERELRSCAVTQESLRGAQSEADRLLVLVRSEADRLRHQLAKRVERAHEVVEEFSAMKAEILELHRARTLAANEAKQIAAEVERVAEKRRQLRRECRESAADLSDLRRALQQVEAEVSAVLTKIQEM
jgi:uncharacterized coiled-coil DUF342 family protein